MKKQLILWIIISSLVTVSCEKDNKNNIKTPLTYQETILGGCFIENPQFPKSLSASTDTVFYNFYQDTLTITVGINYNCCGLLDSEVLLSDDFINIEISDTCMSGCLCYCTCYYTFDFKFTNVNEGNYMYKVFLKELNEPDFKIFKEGTIYIK